MNEDRILTLPLPGGHRVPVITLDQEVLREMGRDPDALTSEEKVALLNAAMILARALQDTLGDKRLVVEALVMAARLEAQYLIPIGQGKAA